MCVGYACVRACVHDSRDELLDGTLNIENAITMDCTYIHMQAASRFGPVHINSHTDIYMYECEGICRYSIVDRVNTGKHR